MKVLIDSLGLQAQVHLQDGRRLADFISILESIPNCSVTFSSGAPLTGGELNGLDVLVITTRYPGEYAYSQEELEAVPKFVRRGGGLLLMSNHGDLPGSNTHDMTQYDAVMARQFGIGLECSWFQSGSMGELWELSGSSLLTTHPIIRGGQGEEPLGRIVTNNCSSILAGGRGHPLVSLSPGMADLRNGYSPSGRLFALALDRQTAADGAVEGRVVTVADSGFIGNDDTGSPGPGLIGHGDNARFVRNLVRWLGRELD